MSVFLLYRVVFRSRLEGKLEKTLGDREPLDEKKTWPTAKRKRVILPSLTRIVAIKLWCDSGLFKFGWMMCLCHVMNSNEARIVSFVKTCKWGSTTSPPADKNLHRKSCEKPLVESDSISIDVVFLFVFPFWKWTGWCKWALPGGKICNCMLMRFAGQSGLTGVGHLRRHLAGKFACKWRWWTCCSIPPGGGAGGRTRARPAPPTAIDRRRRRADHFLLFASLIYLYAFDATTSLFFFLGFFFAHGLSSFGRSWASAPPPSRPSASRDSGNSVQKLGTETR